MTIYIVRHGETEENRQKILQGHMPGTLTENGREQIRKAAERLAVEDVTFSRIVSSDLRRAMESAGIIADRLNIPVIPMEMLRERDWGRFTGIPIQEAIDKYLIDGKWAFPEGSVETADEIYKRAGMALAELEKRFAGETIIVVTHGQMARNLIAAHFKCDYHEVTSMVNAEVRILNAHRHPNQSSPMM